MSKAMKYTISMRALLCISLVSASMIGLGVSYASAADDCITESKLAPPKGSRWAYHTDRATNRKCWFLMKVTIAPVVSQTRRALPQFTVARVSPEQRETSNAGQTGYRGKRKLSESEQETLFLEFLRWKEQRSAVNSDATETMR
jgi:hypothetical protein